MRFFYPDKVEQFKKEFIQPANQFPEFNRLEILCFVEAFREFDLNGNGTIDVYELYLALQEMGQGCTKEEIMQLMNQVDPNRTFELSFTQFLQVINHFFLYACGFFLLNLINR